MSRRIKEIPFYFVDVFTGTPLTGNPLAVVTDSESLNDGAMNRIAREFNQSETTFVLPPGRAEATWRLRCFTPTGFEVFGAGHNALGAWWWIAGAGRASGRRHRERRAAASDRHDTDSASVRLDTA